MSSFPKCKVLLIGGTCWTGQFVWKNYLSRSTDFDNIELYVTYNTNVPEWIPEDKLFRLDLDDEATIRNTISTVKPDIIIHLSAIIFSSAKTQEEKDAVDRINCPTVLINAVNEFVPNCFYIYTSTSFVLDGNNAPYKPDWTLAHQPINAYGRAKYAFEKLVMGLNRSVILRLNNMLGPACAYKTTGNTKFLQWLYGAFQRREYLGLRFDELRSFVFIDDVVLLLLKLVEFGAKDYYSRTLDGLRNILGRVFNVGGPKGLSRLNLAEIIAESYGASLVFSDTKPDDSEAIPTNQWVVYKIHNDNTGQVSSNEQPRDLTMDSSLTELTFDMKFTDMRDAIPKCFDK